MFLFKEERMLRECIRNLFLPQATLDTRNLCNKVWYFLDQTCRTICLSFQLTEILAFSQATEKRFFPCTKMLDDFFFSTVSQHWGMALASIFLEQVISPCQVFNSVNIIAHDSVNAFTRKKKALFVGISSCYAIRLPLDYSGLQDPSETKSHQ